MNGANMQTKVETPSETTAKASGDATFSSGRPSSAPGTHVVDPSSSATATTAAIDDSASGRDNHQHQLANLSSPALETRLRTLRDESNALSQQLTQKLATSRSGQNLLHIGPSLSTLPPDLHSLLASLNPLLTDATSFEEASRVELNRVVRCGNDIRSARRKADHAAECADLYADLDAAERDVRRDRAQSSLSPPRGAAGGSTGALTKRGSEEDLAGIDAGMDGDEADELDELDHIVSLERAALTTLHLVQELKSSTAEVSAMTSPHAVAKHQPSSSSQQEHAKIDATNPDASSSSLLPSLRTPLPDDTEKAQFLMKLAPRIRRLESDATKCLAGRLEAILADMKHRKDESADGGVGGGGSASGSAATESEQQEKDLLMIGHCLRGLALLGRGKEAESAFARVAIMPLIRSKVSMGRLDEGGSRGECAGLFSLLDDIAYSIASTYGPVLRLSEGIFARASHGDGAMPSSSIEVDLVTSGVWVPIVTALMADPAIKMAIFSPGIASILQANYTALDTFLSELAVSLLKSDGEDEKGASSDFPDGVFSSLYFRPALTSDAIEKAQERIYRHPATAEFSKKWNLPIYYQLRFGDCCTRLNKALARVQKDGWGADVYTGVDSKADELRHKQGFELPLFLELYDILLGFWRPDVILRPLTHRFLRGAVQLVGRTIAFIKDGLEGKIRFGEPANKNGNDGSTSVVENGSSSARGEESSAHVYCWGDRVEDVAAVAWELTVLETCFTHDYLETVLSSIAPKDAGGRLNAFDSESKLDELRNIVSDVLMESSQLLSPVISHSWNSTIVDILTAKCCVPLSAVKGVAATYRMTNRPPPTQASPFVGTILRPLKEFDDEFATRTPPQVGFDWKNAVVRTVSERYSVAVEELIATVKRTEDALKSRKARRAAAGGMSDGEKVKLQLYLDHKEFARAVQAVGVEGASVPGVVKLGSLTMEAESLYNRRTN